MTVVLDASAVLAVINREPGEELVVSALQFASISAVNYAEVASKLIEKGLTFDAARMSIEQIGINVVVYDDEQAIRTGELRRVTKQCGLSLADRACLALAEREKAPVLTADRQWAALELGIDIRLIR